MHDRFAHQCFFSFRVCHRLAEDEVSKIEEELQCPSLQIDQGLPTAAQEIWVLYQSIETKCNVQLDDMCK